MNKNPKSVVVGVLLVLAALQPSGAQALSCTNGQTETLASGKIFDNGIHLGETLGTVHLKLGEKKMKCGMFGQGSVGNDGTINFVHTIVCDDQVVFAPTGETIHSQLSLNTTGYADVQACPDWYPPGSTFGSFEETAVPIPGTGRGVFAGVNTGEVHISGTINCQTSIDMQFSGAICLKNAP